MKPALATASLVLALFSVGFAADSETSDDVAADEIPALLPIPPAVAIKSPTLKARRDSLVAQRQALRAAIERHKAECSSVEEGSAEDAVCLSARAQLSADRAQHIVDTKRFNTAVIAVREALAAQSGIPPIAVLENADDLPRLEAGARDEFFWFILHDFRVLSMWWNRHAMIAEPADAELAEAREHLRNYLELVRQIEAKTHTAKTAQERYEQRVRNLTIARDQGNYYIQESHGTVKTDNLPSTSDLAPWTADQLIREGRKCAFKGLTLTCE